MCVKKDEPGRCPRMWRCSGTLPRPIWQVWHADHVYRVCRGNGYNRLQSLISQFSTFRPQTGFVMDVKKNEQDRCPRMWGCSGTPSGPLWQIWHADHAHRVCRDNDYNFLQVLSSQFSTFRPQTGFVMCVKKDKPGRCPRMWRCSGTLPCPLWQVWHADHVYRVCRDNVYNRLQALSSQFSTFRPQTGFVMDVKKDESGRCPPMWRRSSTLLGAHWQVRHADHVYRVCRDNG